MYSILITAFSESMKNNLKVPPLVKRAVEVGKAMLFKTCSSCTDLNPSEFGFWAFSKDWEENSLVECLAVLSRPVFSRQYFWGKINNVLGQVVRGICEVVQAMSEMFCFQSGFLTTWHEILVVLMYMEYSGFKRVIWEKVVLVLWPTQKNCSKAVWS